MKQRKIPLRMCIGCKQMKPKRELLRVVIPKEGEMAMDLSGKQHGRGAYICPDEQCLTAAQRNKAVRLSAQTLASVKEEIAKRTHEEG
jgi:predicted RNA-binding protein YlxR (DUF448 family)